jgi:glycerol kinase
MKMMVLVLLGIAVGLGLIILPTLGAPSFSFFGSATQYSTGDGKNTSGTGMLDNNTTVPAAESQGNGIYRSISQSPAGPFGVPGAILAVGVAVAVMVYLVIRRSVP